MIMALHMLLTYFIVCTFAFEDLIYVYGQGNQEMTEHGRIQYQLLKERSNLPQYGTCWKAAIEHLDEGCRHLSEDTQSDIALHITNCFLEMSGHQTYNCELDKKPNLRAICINDMTDRAFNVYTEFYTHTQNICWFLRGQIWHETIAENTLRVGKQLEVTAANQENLLLAQRESLELQEKMLKHGKFLGMVLDDLAVSSKAHLEILRVLSQSVSNLQAWIVGEVSWFDSIIFYGITVFVVFILTSSPRTLSARLPVFFFLFINLLLERLICLLILSRSDDNDVRNLSSNIYDFVWYSRYGFVFLSAVTLIYRTLMHKDLTAKNNALLINIQKQNGAILSVVQKLSNTLALDKDNLNLIDENLTRKSIGSRQNTVTTKYANGSVHKSSCDSSDYIHSSYSNILYSTDNYREGSAEVSKENILNKLNKVSPSNRTFSPFSELQNGGYNLRSRQCTPDLINS